MLNCPVCGMDMREIERFGVLVDICPSCKGVWLDRGELEKIINYSVSGYQWEADPASDPYAQQPYPQQPPRMTRPPQQPYPQQVPYPQQPSPHKRKRRFGEFLKELFDFD